MYLSNQFFKRQHIEKQAKNLKWHLTKKDVKMTN